MFYSNLLILSTGNHFVGALLNVTIPYSEMRQGTSYFLSSLCLVLSLSLVKLRLLNKNNVKQKTYDIFNRL